MERQGMISAKFFKTKTYFGNMISYENIVYDLHYICSHSLIISLETWPTSGFQAITRWRDDTVKMRKFRPSLHVFCLDKTNHN